MLAARAEPPQHASRSTRRAEDPNGLECKSLALRNLTKSFFHTITYKPPSLSLSLSLALALSLRAGIRQLADLSLLKELAAGMKVMLGCRKIWK